MSTWPPPRCGAGSAHDHVRRRLLGRQGLADRSAGDHATGQCGGEPVTALTGGVITGAAISEALAPEEAPANMIVRTPSPAAWRRPRRHRWTGLRSCRSRRAAPGTHAIVDGCTPPAPAGA